MPIRIGTTTITSVYKGTNRISKAYLGSTLLFDVSYIVTEDSNRIVTENNEAIVTENSIST